MIFLALSAAYIWPVSAQRGAMSEEDRQKWLSEMRNYKHEFLIKELELSDEQQSEFFPVYDAMEDEINKINTDTRELERKAISEEKTSETECSAVARALFEQKSREGEIELAYFEKFKNIITPKQLVRLKNAERKFTQQLVQHHGRMKADEHRRKQ